MVEFWGSCQPLGQMEQKYLKYPKTEVEIQASAEEIAEKIIENDNILQKNI